MVLKHTKPLPTRASMAPIPKKTRRWWLWLLLLFIIAILIFNLVWLMNPRLFLAINAVQITGNYTHVDRPALQQVITPYAESNLAFVDATGLENALTKMAWVATAKVTRVWPNTLKIQLTEHSPVARWNNNQLLAETGQAFDPGQSAVNNANDLPLLEGPSQQAKWVWQTYRDLTSIVAPLGLKINNLVVNSRNSWRLTLNNGMTVILGQNQLTERLQRFVDVYGKVIGSRGSDVNYIDLRYVSGMAIKWKVQ